MGLEVFERLREPARLPLPVPAARERRGFRTAIAHLKFHLLQKYLVLHPSPSLMVQNSALAHTRDASDQGLRSSAVRFSKLSAIELQQK